MAIEWLKSKGYADKDIFYRATSNPDFVCSDGKKYEAKKLYGTTIVVSDVQAKSFADDLTILVFNDKEFVYSFQWGKQDSVPFRISISSPAQKILKASNGTHKKLMTYKVMNNLKSLDEVLNKLLEGKI